MIDLVKSFKEKYELPEDLQWMESVEYSMPQSIEELRFLLDSWSSSEVIGADTETTSLNTRTCTLVGVSISPMTGVSCYIPISHDLGVNLDWDEVRKELDKFFSSRTVIFYNTAFDANVLEFKGMDKFHPLNYILNEDTYRYLDAMVAGYLSNVSDKSFAGGLKALSKKHLGIKMIEFSEVIGSGTEGEFNKVDPILGGAYAAADADMTLRLFEVLEEHTLDSKGKPGFIWRLENKVIAAIRYMERRNLRFDRDKIEEIVQGTISDLRSRQEYIFAETGEEFDISSPDQVAKIVFDKLKVKPKMFTPKGKRATGKKALEAVADSHPIISHIETWRLLNSSVNSFLLKLLVYMEDEDTDEVRMHFNSVFAPTGRLSSDSGGPGSGYTPINAQNIPSVAEFKTYPSRIVYNAEELLDELGADTSEVDLTDRKEAVRKKSTKGRKKNLSTRFTDVEEDE